MTPHPPAVPVDERAAIGQSGAGPQRVVVEVLVCGSPDRADDGAPSVAARMIGDHLSGDARVRIVGQLDIDDLLAVPAGAAVVIVDAATGLRPGQVVDLPLTGLIGGPGRVRPRSSHALAFAEVLGLAELIRGRPVCGRIVAIGAVEFGLGAGLSRPVAAAMPALIQAIRGAIEQVAGMVPIEERF
jgi:hydrogenase maturation protease